MTWEEYNTIIGRIQGKINTEKAYCDNYCKNNPEDAKQRKRDRDMIVNGLTRAMHAINQAYSDGVIDIH